MKTHGIAPLPNAGIDRATRERILMIELGRTGQLIELKARHVKANESTRKRERISLLKKLRREYVAIGMPVAAQAIDDEIGAINGDIQPRPRTRRKSGRVSRDSEQAARL